MKASHRLERLSVRFDDPNLVSNGGLLLAGTLMDRLDVAGAVAGRVDLSGRTGGANTPIKAATVLSALLAGGEWIDDVDVLRAGDSGIVCGHEVRAPSTIGTWLRAFTWGHSLQLDAASADVLARAWAQGGGPGRSAATVVDLDSTICVTYGLFKQGGRRFIRRRGQAATRGYHPLLAVVDGLGQVVGARLREGPANDARGAGDFTTKTLNRVKAAGGGRGGLVVRADAGFYARSVIGACRDADARFSVTVRLNPRLTAAIEAIDEQAWTAIPAWDDGVAEVAETRLPAFAGDDETVRLIVRRVKPKAARPGEQLALLPDWRHHALVTDRAGPLLDIEADHRAHARVENVIRDLKHHAGLAHLPSGSFAANAAWLTLVVLAYNLGRWLLMLGKGIDCFASTKTLRRKLIAWPARTARTARRTILHAPQHWPWAHEVNAALTRLRALPRPG